MPGHDTRTGDTRDRVLAEIRTAATPPTVDELAATLGLHPNSVRLHTAALRESGLVTQDSRDTSGGGRGRPQVTYRTSDRGAWTGRRDYQLLASLLLSELEGDDPAATARRMGRAWGRRIAAEGSGRNDDDTIHTAPDATTRTRIVAALDDLGFEPSAVAESAIGAVQATDIPAGGTSAALESVELRNCPFRELVDPRDGVVCALHAGMLDGLAEETSTDVELIPFTTPQACTVRMRPGSTRPAAPA